MHRTTRVIEGEIIGKAMSMPAHLDNGNLARAEDLATEIDLLQAEQHGLNADLAWLAKNPWQQLPEGFTHWRLSLRFWASRLPQAPLMERRFAVPCGAGPLNALAAAQHRYGRSPFLTLETIARDGPAFTYLEAAE